MRSFKYSPNNNSGSFRHRITFQKNAGSVKNKNGFYEDVWSDILSCWSAIKTSNPREFYSAAQNQVESDLRIIIRYRTDITSDMRVKHLSKSYLIIGDPINDGMENKTLTIFAKEVVADVS